MSLVKTTQPLIPQEIIASTASTARPALTRCFQEVISEIAELSYQNGAFLQQNSHLTSRVEALEASNTKLQSVISKLEESNLQQVKELSRLQADNQYLRHTHQQELQNAHDTITSLQSTQKDMVALETELQYLKKKYQTDSTKAIDKIALLEKEKGGLLKQNEEIQLRLKETVRLHVIEKSNIKSELEKSSTIAGKLSSQNYSLEQANYSLQQDNSYLQRKLDDSGCVIA